ncbi:hypothetical protein DBR11_21410 [Pedobacter sp. HMWF019]|nr:hypothetical protein DBR11_21410 [Pedobacter sp. HMWF019]
MTKIIKNLTKHKFMITKNDLIQYFWNHSNLITSTEGVELQMHGDSLIEASVLLRNHEPGVVRLQLRAAFDPLQRFIEAFQLGSLEDVKGISIENLMLLYKNGKAELCVTEYL